MRFVKLYPSEVRRVTWFAWLPVRIGLETRWLETVTVRQRVNPLATLGGPRWFNEEFIDKPCECRRAVAE